MNSVQRKFLIDRISSKTKARIKLLEDSKLPYTSASNHLYRAIMNGTLELQPELVIKEALTKKALNAMEGTNWLSGERNGYNKERKVTLDIEEMFVLPASYSDDIRRVKDHNTALDREITELKTQLDTLEVRIQLASDKTLQKLINEVDDMGDLSLLDTKLKLLN